MDADLSVLQQQGSLHAQPHFKVTGVKLTNWGLRHFKGPVTDAAADRLVLEAVRVPGADFRAFIASGAQAFTGARPRLPTIMLPTP